MTRFVRAAAMAAVGFGIVSAPLRGQDAAVTLKSGIDTSHVDAEIRPQDDLFRHVNGQWLETAEIPADRSADGAFYALREKAEADLRAIIEAVAAQGDAEPGSEAQKVGDLFASFMDEERIESLGLKPIEDELAEVEAIQDKAAFVRALARLERGGTSGLFAAYVDTDGKQSDRYIIYLGQGGLGLPDESYYKDEKYEEVRDQYVAHIARMFELAGIAEPQAQAEKVMAVETHLAANHWDRVKSRDDSLTYNKTNRQGLSALMPGFDWGAYLDALGTGDTPIEEMIVRQPSFFEALAKALDDLPFDDWKAWLTWNVLNSHASLLSKSFVDEDFEFYGKTLTGTPENRPRWKRAVAAVEGGLGEAVGKLYVEKHFPPDAKERMKDLVANLIEAYRQGIASLDWMSEETKQKAFIKLDTFTPKIGYPDSWRDYSSLTIDRDDLVGNIQRVHSFELARQLAKLGKPVDRGEWFMTPQTVNAYYNPGMNEIVFPAAILQPPFFDLEADDAANYGAIGAVIGHEIGHGFDDQGSKYDGEGNLNNWWTESDRTEFEARAASLIAQYDAYEPKQLPGENVNGALTIGENIGDLGGLTIAHRAYQLALKGEEAPVIDGLTGDQRFFFGWAQVWRTKYRDAEMRRRLAIDPHSPAEFRCNGVIRNMPEYYEAFDVKPGDALFLPVEHRVKIW